MKIEHNLGGKTLLLMDKLDTQEKQEQFWVELSFCAWNDLTAEQTERFVLGLYRGESVLH